MSATTMTLTSALARIKATTVGFFEVGLGEVFIGKEMSIKINGDHRRCSTPAFKDVSPPF